MSNWENNRNLPGLRSIGEISDIYQISLDHLLKRDRKVMEKLIKDSDIKTMENKLNILTLIVWVTSSSILLFIDGDILSSTSMPVLNAISIILRLILIGLLFYTIIKYVKMRNDYQHQSYHYTCWIMHCWIPTRTHCRIIIVLRCKLCKKKS